MANPMGTNFLDALERGLDALERIEASGVVRTVERGLDVAERIDGLGPIGGVALIWESLPQATRERFVGDVCPDCDEPRSRCECCAVCGFTPCACDARFGSPDAEVIETEGVELK